MKKFIFDIGGVLVDYNLNNMKRILSENSILPAEKVNDVWDREIWHADTLALVEGGKIDGRDHFERSVKQLVPDWIYRDWINAWKTVYRMNPLGNKLFFDLLESSAELFLLSNLAHYNLLAVMEKFPQYITASTHNFFSFEMEMLKPNPEIYLEACRIISTEPGECVFIDDNPENVIGAQEAGMMAIHFEKEKFGQIEKMVAGHLC
jgi:putative hydrolase of the HAD superfamily